MKKKKEVYKYAILGILIFLIIIAIVHYKIQQDSDIELNEMEIECYDNGLYFLLTDTNIRSDELNVQNVRCSQEKEYEQWEITGTYFENNDHSREPQSFYFQEIRGGTAPSGADSYYELCLMINNQEVISTRETGGESNSEGARCAWQSELP